MPSATNLLQLYEQAEAEQIDSAENIDEIKHILKSGDLSEFAEEIGSTDMSVIRQTLMQHLTDNQQLFAEAQSSMKKYTKQLKRKGIDIESFHAIKAMKMANEQKDADWKRDCDVHLDKLRPCERTINGVTTRQAIGASGYMGSEVTVTDGDEIDVLEDTPAMANDKGDVFRFYDDANDASEKDDPIRFTSSGAVNVSNFRIQPNLALQMKPHQVEAAEMILKEVGQGESGFLLAHAMGLGKSLTTIATFCAFFHAIPKMKCMLVCPKTLMSSWAAELMKWDDYVNFTYYEPVDEDKPMVIQRWVKHGGLIIIGNDRFRIQMEKEALDIDFIVIDEAHSLKNVDTRFYQSIKDHSPRRKLLLTGSPMQNHLMEYHAMLDLVQPHFMNAAEFRKEFVKVIERGAMADADSAEVTAAQIKIDVLQRRFSRYSHRRSVAVLKASLPTMHDFKLTYRVAGYDGIVSSKDAFEQTQQTITASIKQKTGLAVKLLNSIAKQTNGSDFCIVFSKRKDVLLKMSELISGPIIDGTTDAATRQRFVEEFQHGQHPVLYSTIKVGGVGLNLQRGNRILILDPSWNPVDDKQACFRAYRYGQQKEVYIYRFIVANSIEECIYRCAIHKNSAACRIIDEKEVERHFTRSQLQALQSFPEKVLKKTKDECLNAVIKHFDTCSAYALLFAEAEKDKLSEREQADADNAYNILMKNQSREITVGDQTQLVSSKDIFDSDGKLIPPLPICWKYNNIGHLEFEPIQPYSQEILHYTIEVLDLDNTLIKRMKPAAALVGNKQWTLKIGVTVDCRLRCCSHTADVTSEWSESSAILFV